MTFVLTSGGHNAGIVSQPGSHRAADAQYVDPETWYAQVTSDEGSWWTAWVSWLGTNSRAYEPINHFSSDSLRFEFSPVERILSHRSRAPL